MPKGKKEKKPTRKRLTARFITGLQPTPGKRETIYDDVVRGMYAQTHGQGVTFGVWKHVHSTGKPVRVTLGRYQPNVFDLVDARREAQVVLHAIALGKDPAAERRRAKMAGTFGALADAYLADAQIRRTTKREWERILSSKPLAGLCAMKSTEVVRGDLVRLFDKIRAASLRDGGKSYAANRALEAVRRVFSWAVQKDLLPASPCVGVLKPTKEQARHRAYTDAELGAIVLAFGDTVTDDAIRLCLFTGVRISQALGAP